MKEEVTTAPKPRAPSKYWPVLALIACNILIGLLIFPDYGLTVDEPANMGYGRHVVDFYRSGLGSDYPLYVAGNLDQKGPAYFVFATIIARLGAKLMPAVGEVAFWHLAGFLLFQLAVFAIYDLALRWMDPWGAFAVSALFATQPLLWGHAFINPKDSPFMVLFLASVTFGLRMADRVIGSTVGGSLDAISPGAKPVEGSIAEGSSDAKAWKGRALLGLGGLIVLALSAGAAFSLRKTIVASLVAYVHSLASTNLIRVGYSYFSDSPVLDAAKKIVLGDKGFLTGVFVLLVVTAILVVGIAVFSRRSPELMKWFGRSLGRSFRDPAVILAGILLGLTVSIRVLGPYAGAMVGLWMIAKGRWKTLPALLAYATIATSVAYLTWPFLWENPASRFLDSLFLMSDYPNYGKILFDGQFYRPQSLPSLYIPTLMGIQLTEPVWVLFAISLVVIGYRVAKNRWGLDLVLLLLTWLVLPVLGFIVTDRPIYDNIRQLHFLLPPIFLVSGVGVSWILARLQRTGLRVALLALILLPGIIQLVQLHPYEYVYYNQFVGGLGGASRRFEPDYWRASAAEAAEYLNRVAPPHSTVYSVQPAQLTPFLRKDLEAREYHQGAPLPTVAGYMLIPTRRNVDLRLLAGRPALHVIGRQGMEFVLIKQVFAKP